MQAYRVLAPTAAFSWLVTGSCGFSGVSTTTMTQSRYTCTAFTSTVLSGPTGSLVLKGWSTMAMPAGTAPELRVCCHIRRKLAGEYATYARLFAEAVVLVTTGTVDIERLKAATREAQERVEAARVAFEEHMASHGC
jgi:hypothetical protein